MSDYFRDKRVLVTGCCGTVGNELVRQLVDEYHVGECIGIDNNESELFFKAQEYSGRDGATFFLGDVRDRQELLRRSRGVDIIFHAAAFKHVGLCEQSPSGAVQTNILGVENVIAAAGDNGVSKVIFTSSDKAVNPTNVMGTSKLMGEKLVSAANTTLHGNGPAFLSTRFGNVLGSRGSVLPVFAEQIRQGGPVTLTHPDMTRFIMSTEQAVHLVIDSAIIGKGGEVFVTKMPVCRIEDLAQVLIQELAPMNGYDPESIAIEEIGAKPGEKMYEELMSSEETRRSWELKNYFVTLPALPNLYRNIEYEYEELVSRTVNNPYVSSMEPALDRDSLAEFLKTHCGLGPQHTDAEPNRILESVQ